MSYDTGFGGDQQRQPPISPAASPDSFTGPGMDTTSPGYIPQYGITDPTVLQGFAHEFGANQALAAGIVGGAPQFMQNQIAGDRIANQQAYNYANYGLESGALNSNYQNQLAQLGLQRDRLGVQQGALARQGPLQALLHQIATQGFDLNRTNAWQSADVANRSATSNAITRGANTSIGFNNQLGDIRNQLAGQLSGIDLNQLREGANYGETQAGLGDQKQFLDIQGKQIGLSGDQLLNQLNLGLERLGLSSTITARDLADKMQSNSLQDQILAQQIYNQAIQNSDYYSQFYPGFSQLQQPSVTPGAAAGSTAGTGPGGTSSTNPSDYGLSPGGVRIG